MPTLQLLFPFTIPGDLVDDNTDMRKIEIPNPTGININKVIINSMTYATGTPSIDVCNSSGGAGDSITTTFVDGEDFAEATGTMSVTTYVWVRNANVSGGNLSNINGWVRGSYSS